MFIQFPLLKSDSHFTVLTLLLLYRRLGIADDSGVWLSNWNWQGVAHCDATERLVTHCNAVLCVNSGIELTAFVCKPLRDNLLIWCKIGGLSICNETNPTINV